MIKKILGLITLMIITVIAVIKVNVYVNRNELSDLFMANVEALANCEDGTTISGTVIRIVHCDRITTLENLLNGSLCATFKKDEACELTINM